MKNILKFFYLVFALSISTAIYAQKPIKIYPKVHAGDGKNKPFDKEYDLLIPYDKKDTVYQVLLYKHKGGKSFSNSLDKEKTGTIKTANLKSGWEKINDTNFLRVELHYIESEKNYTLLKPSKSYSFIIFRGLTTGSKRIIDALRNEYNNSPSHVISTGGSGPAFTEFLAQRARQDNDNKIITYDGDFNKYIDFYTETLRPLEENLSNKEKADRGFKVTCEGDRLFSDDCIGDLLKLFNGNGCINLPVKCVDTCYLLSLILSLKKLNCENDSFFVKGRLTLSKLDLADTIAINKYANRKSNIETNISDLQKLKKITEQFRLQLNAGACKEYIDCLSSLEHSIDTQTTLLKNAGTNITGVTDGLDEINESMLNGELFSDYDISSADSYIYDFKARNEMAITPVFGYSYYGFQKGFGGFTPYLGFQVNFQGINREDPFNQIKRKIVWQRLCFTTAWTMVAMEEKDKRDDLFDKSSLITALGFKLSHIVMLNAGGLWFKKEDPNPIITTKKIAVAPVLAVSLNLEINELLNGFSKLVPKK